MIRKKEFLAWASSFYQVDETDEAVIKAWQGYKRDDIRAIATAMGAPVEYVRVCGVGAEYVNAGDTYNVTILRTDGGEWHITTWGDWVEATEAEHADDAWRVR